MIKKEIDFRKEIVEMSKRFPNLRFGQFICNAFMSHRVDMDLYDIPDSVLHAYCSLYCKEMLKK